MDEPEEWMTLVEKTRKIFKGDRMQQDFISTDPVSKEIMNRKIDTTKNTVNWLQIRWMRFSKKQPEYVLLRIFEYGHTISSCQYRCKKGQYTQNCSSTQRYRNKN